MSTLKTLVCAFVLLISHHTFAAIGVDMQGYFAQGNTAYSRGDWIAARDAYEKALQLGQSASLRYNLGNVCYLQGCYGVAIWNYKCALALDPNDDRIQANLTRTLQKLDLTTSNNSLVEKMAYNLNASAWGWIACLSLWAFIGFVVFPRMYDKSGPLMYAISILFALLFISACLSLNVYHQSRNIAIVLRSDTPIYKAAAPSSGIIGYAREGEAVRLDSHTHQDYVRLTTPKGVTGWASTSSIGPIWN